MGFFFFRIFTSHVNLNKNAQNLAPVSNTGLMLGCLIHLGSYRMNRKDPREVWKAISPAVQYFIFYSPSWYLETAAWMSANNFNMIFSLRKNVTIYQQLKQSKYCKKFFAGPSCEKINYFFVCFIFSFCLLFSLCRNEKIMFLFTKLCKENDRNTSVTWCS